MPVEAPPAGNAAVGDQVVLVWPDAWQHGWTITEIGLPDDNGRPYVVRVRDHAGKETTLNVHSTCVLIQPAKLDDEALRITEKYDNLVLFRRVGNNDEDRFDIYCSKCRAALTLIRRETTSADVVFTAREGLWEAKPGLDGNDETISCKCPDVTYDLEVEPFG